MWSNRSRPWTTCISSPTAWWRRRARSRRSTPRATRSCASSWIRCPTGRSPSTIRRGRWPRTWARPSSPEPAAPRSVLAQEEIVDREQDLDHDQHHDVELQPQRVARFLQLDERLRHAPYQVELALQVLAPFLDLELVLEPDVKAFQVGPVPQQLGLLGHGEAADHQVL